MMAARIYVTALQFGVHNNPTRADIPNTITVEPYNVFASGPSDRTIR